MSSTLAAMDAPTHPTGRRQILAARMHDRGDVDGLVVDRIAINAPGEGEVLVAMRSAGVTSNELTWSTAWVDAWGQERLLVVPGHEMSGLVVEVGPEVQRFSIGDAVFGIPDFFRGGALAQFILVAEEGLIAKPRRVSHDAAAALALSGLTAWQALFVEGRVGPGEHVLVHAGAGGIGHLAVQLARWAGARVSATASRDSLSFVRDIGADRVIDYRAERFDEVLADVDLVIDTLGGETLTRSLAILGEAGRLISVARHRRSMPEVARPSPCLHSPTWLRSLRAPPHPARLMIVFAGASYSAGSSRNEPTISSASASNASYVGSSVP